MDDKDIEYAVKRYQKESKKGEYSYDKFVQDIRDHLSQRPFPKNSYDPFSLMAQTSNLWRMLAMSMQELVEYSKLDMAKFSRRFCIPYRTLQAWCDGTNPCPVYIKMMLGEILKVYSRDIRFDDMNGDLIMRMSDNMPIDMNTGELHFTSSWHNEEDDE